MWHRLVLLFTTKIEKWCLIYVTGFADWILNFEIRRTSRKNQNSLKFGFRFDHEIYGSAGMSRWQVNSLMFRLGFGHKNCESAGRQWRRVVLCLDGASLCICRQNIPRASTVPTLRLCHCAYMCGRVFPLGAAIVQTGADKSSHLEQRLWLSGFGQPCRGFAPMCLTEFVKWLPRVCANVPHGIR